jgi:hypothetical protein
MNILKIWGLVILGYAFILGESQARADQLVWDTPAGNFNLNLQSTEALLGYDAILKQSIAGASLPVYTDPKGIIAVQLGAVAPWPTNAAGVEPYLAAGHDILKEIPYFNQFSSCHLNIFGRYATSQGKAGVGLSFSYSFATSSTPSTTTTTFPEIPPPTIPVP